MKPPSRNLTSAQAAAHLGVSAKALRLYEEANVLVPGRSAAGWRLYGPDDLERAATIVALRSLGLSLTQVADSINGNARSLAAVLAAREEQLVLQAARLETNLRKVRTLGQDLGEGASLDAVALRAAFSDQVGPAVGFELPWPWAGEWFELRDCGPLNFITGPLGSGKTRFAERLAAELPDGHYIGRNRSLRESNEGCSEPDGKRAERVVSALGWLHHEGAEPASALRELVRVLEADEPASLVIDMVEEGLPDASQRALMAWLRRRRDGRSVFLMTRSSIILDLDLVRSNERIIYCPANHGPPFLASAYPGGHGFEAVSTCVASPKVRERTAGIVAVRLEAAEPA